VFGMQIKIVFFYSNFIFLFWGLDCIMYKGKEKEGFYI